MNAYQKDLFGFTAGNLRLSATSSHLFLLEQWRS